MRNKVFSGSGILAPIVYVAAVILGGILWPAYSHVAQPVSDLIATGAPNKGLLDPLFALYNLLTLVFAWGLWQWVQQEVKNPRRRFGQLAALALILEGLAGLATLFFPEEPGFVGAMHIGLASVSSLTTMLAMGFLAGWFGAQPGLSSYLTYSLISLGLVFVSGGLAGVGVATASPLAGLAERITIGGFLQWLLVVAWLQFSPQTKLLTATP